MKKDIVYLIIIFILFMGVSASIYFISEYDKKNKQLQEELRASSQIVHQNDIAAQHEVTIYKDKLGQYQTQVAVLAMDFNRLADRYHVLTVQYNNSLNHVISLTQTNTTLIDSIDQLKGELTSVKLKDGEYALGWTESFSSADINGTKDYSLDLFGDFKVKYNYVDSTLAWVKEQSKLNYKLNLVLTTALELTKDSLLYVNVRNSNPKIKFDIISNFDPEVLKCYLIKTNYLTPEAIKQDKTKFSVGFTFGPGFGYDIYNNQGTWLGIYLGFGITYNIWEF